MHIPPRVTCFAPVSKPICFRCCLLVHCPNRPRLCPLYVTDIRVTSFPAIPNPAATSISALISWGTHVRASVRPCVCRRRGRPAGSRGACVFRPGRHCRTAQLSLGRRRVPPGHVWASLCHQSAFTAMEEMRYLSECFSALWVSSAACFSTDLSVFFR